MPFGTTVAGDGFERKVDECLGKLKQLIIITDDIMVVGYKPDHSDHNQAFNSLLQTAQKCNVKLNFDKLHSLVRPILQVVTSQQEAKSQL